MNQTPDNSPNNIIEIMNPNFRREKSLKKARDIKKDKRKYKIQKKIIVRDSLSSYLLIFHFLRYRKYYLLKYFHCRFLKFS